MIQLANIRVDEKKRRGPIGIDGLIASFVREHSLRSGGGYAQVFDAWNEAVPEMIRSHATPVRFRGGVLTVEVNSTTQMQELKNFTGENYRRKANKRLGNKTIQRIAFKLGG